MSEITSPVPTPYDREARVNVLAREHETYRRELPQLLAHEGQFVLIHGDHVDSVWSTFDEAIQAGYERFGLKPFMVRPIQKEDRPILVLAGRGGKCHR